jgi:hypothetical protein
VKARKGGVLTPEMVYRSTGGIDPRTGRQRNGLDPWMSFDEWTARGCPSLLDYDAEEQAVVDAYLQQSEDAHASGSALA